MSNLNMIQLGAPSPRVNKLSPFPDKPSPNQSQIVFAICHNLVQISNSKNKAKFFEKYTNSVCPKLSFFNETRGNLLVVSLYVEEGHS